MFSPPAPASGTPRPAPSIPSGALASGAVTLTNLATGAVDSPRIVDGAITAADLANGSVTGGKLQLPLIVSANSVDPLVSISNLNREGLEVTSASGTAVIAESTASNGAGLVGRNTDNGEGIIGVTTGTPTLNASAVVGRNNGTGAGVRGFTAGGAGTGVLGQAGLEAGTGLAGRFENVNPSNASDVLLIAGAGAGDLIQAQTSSGGTNTRFRVSSTGNVTADGMFTGGGADVAEFIDSVDTLEAGDVVEIDSTHAGRFRRSIAASSPAVAGVITSRPGVLMNASEDRDDLTDGPALALAGRVPVKVSNENGAIATGDLLVSSITPGHAMKASANPAPGAVIGKALGALVSGTGVIEMLVMLR